MTKAPAHPSKWIAFTDGASSGNPGPGGWGAIVASPRGEVRELGGGEPRTTNNRMELLATIEALRVIPNGQLIDLYTDSTYVIKGITQWIWGWMKKGWMTAEGKEVLNREFWEALHQELQRVGKNQVSFNYVPGHSGVPGNERVDQIGVAFSKKIPVSLYQGSLEGYGVDLSVTKTALRAHKKTKPPSSGPATYLSLIGTVPARHKTWAECEARVKGQSGAKFKKVTSQDEERSVLRSWGVKPDRF